MKPLMKYHGAKFRLAPWIMQHFPSHHTYVEPYGGAAGLLLQKPKSTSEVYNDLDEDIVNVFRVLRDKEDSRELERLIALTPYARAEFLTSLEIIESPIERARRTIVRAEMGFGSASATRKYNGFGSYTGTPDDMNVPAHRWVKYPERIKTFVERLQGLIVECLPAVDVIKKYDNENTLFYIDPPYVKSTRSMGKHKNFYRFEMEDEEHAELLRLLLDVKGKVILSGYENDIYKDYLTEWKKFDVESQVSSQKGGSVKRSETIWLNPACTESQEQLRLM